MTTDITELAQREKFEAWAEERCALPWGYLKNRRTNTGYFSKHDYTSLWAAWKAAGAELLEALEKAQQRISQLESRTLKLPDGWQFEECEIEGCENGAIFSVGTGSRNIHLCDKCAHEPENSRLKKSPLSKRLPFKMSAGIKVEAE
ncbi:TPA: hypothetical protein LVM06_001397 [Klebsiella michiganensis]|nr:hypothetical protein [Klebsiella michiganensis]HEM8805883.1 hypothetical protein [Klebsiella michiganensis]